jgi:hypothetical protein
MPGDWIMKKQISDIFGDIRLVHRKTMKVKTGSTTPLREAGSSAAPGFNPSHAMQPSSLFDAAFMERCFVKRN